MFIQGAQRFLSKRKIYHELDTILAMPEAIIPRYVRIVNQLATEFTDSSAIHGALNKLMELRRIVGGTGQIAFEVEQRKFDFFLLFYLIIV